MAWVRFTEDYSYRLPTSTTDYKAGMVLNVTRDCAKKAVKLGRAINVKTPTQNEKGQSDYGAES